MKTQAVGIGQLAVTGELGTALGAGPFLAGMEQRLCHALSAAFFLHVDSFRIPNRAGGGALGVIVAKLALGEANDAAAPLCGKKRRFGFRQKGGKRFFQRLGGMVPQLGRQRGNPGDILFACFGSPMDCLKKLLSNDNSYGKIYIAKA